MVKTLEQAIAEVATLPAADQEHVEKLRELRADIDKGLRSLDAGEGTPLDIEEFIRQANVVRVIDGRRDIDAVFDEG